MGGYFIQEILWCGGMTIIQKLSKLINAKLRPAVFWTLAYIPPIVSKLMWITWQLTLSPILTSLFLKTEKLQWWSKRTITRNKIINSILRSSIWMKWHRLRKHLIIWGKWSKDGLKILMLIYRRRMICWEISINGLPRILMPCMIHCFSSLSTNWWKKCSASSLRNLTT